MSTCRSCHEPIIWGMTRDGKWRALDPEPTTSGAYTFLSDKKWIIRVPTYQSFDQMPEDLRNSIIPEMVPFWRKTLDGPRYQLHSPECQADVAMSAGNILKEVLQ